LSTNKEKGESGDVKQKPGSMPASTGSGMIVKTIGRRNNSFLHKYSNALTLHFSILKKEL
jgi:hypothetical protein